MCMLPALALHVLHVCSDAPVPDIRSKFTDKLKRQIVPVPCTEPGGRNATAIPRNGLVKCVPG